MIDQDSGLVANPPSPAALPVTLLIDADHLLVTLYGTPTPEDRAYYAALMVSVHGATKANYTTEDER